MTEEYVEEQANSVRWAVFNNPLVGGLLSSKRQVTRRTGKKPKTSGNYPEEGIVREEQMFGVYVLVPVGAKLAGTSEQMWTKVFVPWTSIQYIYDMAVDPAPEEDDQAEDDVGTGPGAEGVAPEAEGSGDAASFVVESVPAAKKAGGRPRKANRGTPRKKKR